MSNSPLASSVSEPTQHGPGRTLLFYEEFWRDQQQWLEESGYMLRPRHKPDWKPSWSPGDHLWAHEDAIVQNLSSIMDATRIKDGREVLLKHISYKQHPHEMAVSSFFTARERNTDPRNHCVRLLDLLDVPYIPDEHILVFPLSREASDPPFETIGEFVEFVRQIIEGVQYMHTLNVAHRDIMDLNTMMDAKGMYPDSFHPQVPSYTKDGKYPAKFFSRTERPPKYYLIDFGLSHIYRRTDAPPLEMPIYGGVKTVPEFQGEHAYVASDPFPTDIYYLGNMIGENFTYYRGLKFLRPLVEVMQNDPAKRPDIDEVARQFEKICTTVSAFLETAIEASAETRECCKIPFRVCTPYFSDVQVHQERVQSHTHTSS
ncbi:hypothetical protein C8Q75DRAFT_80049 [Abortiporus biennis]|nr:hypothetical protein C8Q75DRAFT_80049 [Abortiporus biennis]